MIKAAQATSNHTKLLLLLFLPSEFLLSQFFNRAFHEGQRNVKLSHGKPFFFSSVRCLFIRCYNFQLCCKCFTHEWNNVLKLTMYMGSFHTAHRTRNKKNLVCVCVFACISNRKYADRYSSLKFVLSRFLSLFRSSFLGFCL